MCIAQYYCIYYYNYCVASKYDHDLLILKNRLRMDYVANMEFSQIINYSFSSDTNDNETRQ